MGIFSSGSKSVSETEFKNLMRDLSVKLDQRKRLEIEKMFHSDLASHHGITETEFAQGLEWFRDNSGKHVLNEADLELLEETFQKYL